MAEWEIKSEELNRMKGITRKGYIKKPAESAGLKFLAWLMLSLHQNHPIEMTA